MTGSARRVAVVLFNLGGPDRLGAVRPFLFNLFRDPAIIAAPAPVRYAAATLIAALRTRSAQAGYARMGGASPILRETEAQAQALADALVGDPGLEVRVIPAMRYWNPSVRAAAEEVAAWGAEAIVLLPLYPQYSTTTTASSLDAWRRAYKGAAPVHVVCCYPEHPGFIEAHARRIEDTWRAAGSPKGLRLLFSAHGLPEKVVAGGDPYQWQVERTCTAVADRLGSGWDWSLCYQSRVGPLKWLGPSTPEAIAEAAAEGRGVLVAPVAFVSEHIETLVELDHDYRRLAEEVGSPAYLRAPALGLEPNFIEALADMVRKALTRPAAISNESGGRLCPASCGRCLVEGAP